MNFAQAISSVLSNYVNFSGRASRSEYWYWCLFGLIISIIAGVIDEMVFGGLQVLGTILFLGLFLPGIAVGFRRLHDIDRTSWWGLIALTGVGLILLIVWACVKGTTGPNRFGADPLGRT